MYVDKMKHFGGTSSLLHDLFIVSLTCVANRTGRSKLENVKKLLWSDAVTISYSTSLSTVMAMPKKRLKMMSHY